jgi:predicted phage baseplate assembly protein
VTQELRLVVNRPGLSAIAYRIATHGRFRRNLLERIAAEPALRGLTTRGDDDFAIAMLDAWSSAADVLTFYQERLANESYLRTATERESLGHLARLLGYELGPGVSAGAALAFTVDPVTSRGEPVPLPAGVKVQSIPGPDQPPQTFETSESIDARVLYNELRPSRAGVVTGPLFRLTLDSIKLDELGPEDDPHPLLIFSPGAGGSRMLLRRYTAAAVDGLIVITWRGPEPPADDLLNVVIFNRASDVRDIAGDLVTLEPVPPTYKLSEGFVVPVLLSDKTGDEAYFSTLGTLSDASSLRVPLIVRPGQRAPGSFAPDRTARISNRFAGVDRNERRLLLSARLQVGDVILAVRADDPRRWRVSTVEAATARPDVGGTDVILARFRGPTFATPSAAPERLFVLRKQAAIFGHNAPDPLLLGGVDKSLFVGENPAGGWVDFGLIEGLVELDAVYPGIIAGDRLLLRDGAAVRLVTVTRVETNTLARYALTSRATRLLVVNPGEGDPLGSFNRRRTEIFFAPEPLSILADPRTDPVEGAVIDLATPVPDLAPGRAILVSGTPEDATAPATEIAVIAAVAPGGATLTLTASLLRSYRRDTVTIRANVARATHGETVTEILGGGDPGAPLQRFDLKQAPLTHISAQNARGRVNTLEVFVDGERWREVDTFEGTGPKDHVYVVQLGDEGAASIQFGDGVRGARPPSGTANVRASYRRGTGLPGLVRAGQLSLLTAPPRGILAVTNPLPSAGAAAPEALADARRNAPLQVRTIGRVVSLRDYEDFARAFTGVAKAHAVAFRDRDRQGILVTVAGFGDTQIPSGTPTHDNLLAALRDAGAPGVLVRLQPYTAVPFTVAGRVTAAPDRDLPTLRAALRAALLARFGFDAREFARPLYPSELVAAIQAVPGVVAVDLTSPSAPLPAFAATRPATPDAPALTELLTIDLTDPTNPNDPLALGGLEVTR